jgi:sugar lactone lactonase YvrE
MIPLLILSYFDIFLAIFNSVQSNMSFKVEPLSKNVSDLGEGPHWDNKIQSLYYVDAFVGDVCRLDVKSGESEKFNLRDLVTIVIPFKTDNNLLLVSLRNKCIKLDFNTKQYEVIASVAPELKGKERFNDGKCDAMGRLWIGTVLEGPNGIVPEGGSLYRLDSDHFTKMSDKFTISNGMAWNLNNTKMYFNDSEGRKIYVFDYELKSGTISKRFA